MKGERGISFKQIITMCEKEYIYIKRFGLGIDNGNANDSANGQNSKVMLQCIHLLPAIFMCVSILLS